jgi:hypothetical protein
MALVLSARLGPDGALLLGAVVVWGLAAFAGTTMGRRAGGPTGLVALGLAVFVFPTMWRTTDVAFSRHPARRTR